jgi:hypothetical protein
MSEENSTSSINELRELILRSNGGISGQLAEQRSINDRRDRKLSEMGETQNKISASQRKQDEALQKLTESQRKIAVAQEVLSKSQKKLVDDQVKMTRSQREANANAKEIADAIGKKNAATAATATPDPNSIEAITAQSIEKLEGGKKGKGKGKAKPKNENDDLESIEENRRKPSKPTTPKAKPTPASGIRNNEYISTLNAMKSAISDQKKSSDENRYGGFLGKLGTSMVKRGDRKGSSAITKLIGGGIKTKRGIGAGIRGAKSGYDYLFGGGFQANRRNKSLDKDQRASMREGELLNAKQARLESLNTQLKENPTDAKLLAEKERLTTGKKGIDSLKVSLDERSDRMSKNVVAQENFYRSRLDKKGYKSTSKEDRGYLNDVLLKNVRGSFNNFGSNGGNSGGGSIGASEAPILGGSNPSSNTTNPVMGGLGVPTSPSKIKNPVLGGKGGGGGDIFSTKIAPASTPTTAGHYIASSYGQLLQLNTNMEKLTNSDFGGGGNNGGGLLGSLMNTIGGVFTSLMSMLSGVLPMLAGGLGVLGLGKGLMKGAGKFVMGKGNFWRRAAKTGSKRKALAGTLRATKTAVTTAGKKGAGKGLVKGGGSALSKVVGKTAGKGLAKTALKKVPIIGALAGIGFGISRAMSGDFVGAGMEVASGLASTVPGAGTAASFGIDAALIARDVTGGSSRSAANTQSPQQANLGLSRSNIDSEDKIDMMRIQAKLIASEMFKMQDSEEYRESQRPIVDSYSSGMRTALN